MALKHTEGRVVVSVDLEAKNWHTFENGLKIRRERQFNELNRRITEPVNAICISGEGIADNAEILVHHNAACETNLINNYKKLSGEDAASTVKYYSIPQEQCFFWKDENDVWQPLPPYETALRIFEPYNGVFEGIEPTLIKDTLYVTSGELKGLVVKTVKAADYQIVFQNTNGKEGNLIRFRPNGDPKTQREEEAIAILHKETELVKRGKLLVGIEVKDAKKVNELSYA